MNFTLSILVGAALCLGLVVLTAVLIILALRRGSRAISQGMKERAEEQAETPQPVSANSRWARGDLQAAPEPPKADVVLEPCPACGGENPRGAQVCAFCGRKL